MLIFELSQPGRSAAAQITADSDILNDLPEQFRRKTPIGLPEGSELQPLRRDANLSRKNFVVRQAAGAKPAHAAAA
jgi:glycine dehydrogenase subunit 2